MSTYHTLSAAWAQEDYREAQGILDPVVVHRTLKLTEEDELYDFGCGNNDMVRFLRDYKGVNGLGIDVIRRSPEVKLRNITEMADVFGLMPRDYGLCLGVMDHIPENKVAQTILNINHCARKEILFSIPIRDLGYNDLVGKKVQQTIKPLGWWRNHLTAIGKVAIGQTGDWMTAHVKCA